MKKIYFTIVLLLMVAVDISQAQLATDSWAFGFGFRYPRYIGVQVTPTHSNYGGYLSLQRNFSEHFGLRFKGGFSHMEGTWVSPPPALATITESTNLISGDLDLMFYLIPCEPISPYLYGGVGGTYRMLTNKETASLDDNATGAEWNFGLGVDWAIDTDWKIVTEFGYHSTSNSELDGFVSPNGNDSYWGVNIGFLYLFAQGEPSKLCELYPGITETKDLTLNDLNKIEAMIVKHIPKEITKEVVVEKQAKAANNNWVLVGVNFAFDKSSLLPESYPILYNAAELLLLNPDTKVEIQGYCDYIGSVEYNNKLSLRRAETVKMFLVSKGIAKDRLTTVGFGKSNPVADNETEDGRAMNRRIEFKIIN